ncbi:MAG: DeoR/GlpR family DNA-binding transcription regulator [Actinomycetota bacterium]|jgi:DeoR family transcriptional regulator of aga operon|nr:DeoR/GlpR family DNA-binding transcription regulator [Actinomycetota bacterium]
MIRHERLVLMLEMLASTGTLSVDSVVKEFGVSTATARRDLDELHSQHLLTRSRGGALPLAATYDLPMRYKSVQHSDEKQRIARAAATLIRPASVFGLNGGTTTIEIARQFVVPSDKGQSDPTPITIVTNAINIAVELALRPNVKLVLTGGVVRPESYELVGPLSRGVIENVSIDVLFLGVNGLSPFFGAMAANESEAETNRLMVSRSATTVVVTDSSKLGQHAFSRVCESKDIDLIITDDGAAADIVEAFRNEGVEVWTV